QSLILGGQLLPVNGTDDLLALDTANQSLGGDFLARLNMDLRETKHWSYGVFGIVSRVEHRSPYIVLAPVQADRTGDSLVALRTQINDFLTTRGTTAEERDRAISGSIRELPGNFETSAAVLGALEQNDLYNRPDDYYDTLASRLRGFTAAQLDEAARRAIDPDRFIWVVVGDASRVRGQLDQVGLPVEVVQAQ